MKEERNQKFIAWGLTAFLVVAASLILSFLINRFGAVQHFFGRITGILMPIIYGFIMAFLMAPMYNAVSNGCLKFFLDRKFRYKTGRGLAHFIATLLSILVILLVVVGLVAMLIPQLVDSVQTLFHSIPNGINSFSDLVRHILANNQPLADEILKQYEAFSVQITEWATGELYPNINKYLTSLSSGVIKFLNFLKDFLIGIIVMAYVLNIKGTLSAQVKKIVYSVFRLSIANDVVEESRYVKWVFSNFIVGKLIDSAIIGVMCFVGLSIMRTQYALLISVFVGVTNIIPFFGPFIGAIPSAFILLLVSPFQCLQFLIFILVLQQFDGNILGPKILGQTTGLSSFWVLFSILFFGGLWGIVGMVIGVPTFAVLYRLVGRLCTSRLKKKHLSFRTADYWDLLRINEETGTYEKKEGVEVPRTGKTEEEETDPDRKQL